MFKLQSGGIISGDRPDVKIKNHGLGQYGAEPIYVTILATLCIKSLNNCFNA